MPRKPKPQGRPKVLPAKRSVPASTTLSPEETAHAVKIGDGYKGRGIRLAVQESMERAKGAVG